MKSFSLAVVVLLFSSAVRAELPSLIPRDVLFGDPGRISPTLSPDGTRLAWIAPDARSVLQVWVETIGKGDARTVTADEKRGIRQYFWAKDNHTLLYEQDNDGDENFHLYGVDVVAGGARDLTPVQGVRADWVCLNPSFPDTVLVSLNARDRTLFDVYRLNLRDGSLKLDTENPGDVSGWLADPAFRVRAAQVATPDGGVEIRVRGDESSPWKPVLKAGPGEVVEALGFTGDAGSLYLASSVGRDTAAVVRRDIATGVETLVAASDDVDAGDVQIDPRRHVVEAVAFSPGRTTWQVIDPAVKEDFASLAKLSEGDFVVVSRTEADDVWLVGYASDRAPGYDRAPGHFYAWDRKTRRGTFLFASRPKLERFALAEMKAVVIPTRDGLKMNCYLTLPVGVPARRLPLIVYPHGGPWERDKWGYNGNVQWLANRGYAVLQPNYRGSLGFGKKHFNAGNKQWGLKMHDDLIDAVAWAVKEGVADPAKVGIVGGSYGGYCALNGVTLTPDVFACAVDICGPSNLRTMIGSIPAYWKPMRSLIDARVANVDDPNDAELIRRASPLNRAGRIVRPLFIEQGANDPRVKQAESEQMVAAIEKNGGAVTYVLYPDEGHGVKRTENRLDLSARIEAFLGEFLGGRVEAMAAERVPGSTAVVKEVGGAR